MENKNNTKGPKLYMFLELIFLILLLLFRTLFDGLEVFILRVLALFFFFISIFFIFLPFYQLRKFGETTSEDDYMQTYKVVDRGLYSLVRHPQYLGYILLVCGYVLLRLHLLIILVGVCAIILFYLQMRSEEKFLLQKFGKAYLEYQQRVPALNLPLGLWLFFRNKVFK